MKKNIFTVFIIFGVLSFPNNLLAQKIKFELHDDISSGSSNIISLTRLLTQKSNSILSDVLISFPLVIFGHEFCGHGSELRKYNEKAKYYILPPHVNFKENVDYSIQREILAAGPRFNNLIEENEIRLQFQEEKTRNISRFNLIVSKMSTLGSLIDNSSGCDFVEYSKYSQNASLKRIRKYGLFSFFDPSMMKSLLEFRNIKKYHNNSKFIISSNIDITKFYVGGKVNLDTKYFRVGITNGIDYKNKKIYGFELSIYNLYILNSIRQSIEFDYIQKYKSNITITEKFKNIFIKIICQKEDLTKRREIVIFGFEINL